MSKPIELAKLNVFLPPSVGPHSMERTVRSAHTKPMYELIIRDVGTDYPAGGLKVWVDGKCIGDYALSLYCKPAGLFATTEELVATAIKMVSEFQKNPKSLDTYQDYQETYIP